MAADVWALGQIAYQLVTTPSEDKILSIPEEFSATSLAEQQASLLNQAGDSLWTSGNHASLGFRTLIASMVLPDPASRPTIENVLARIETLTEPHL